MGFDEGVYRGLLHSFDTGFCILQVLFDTDRRPVDYRFLEVNAVFEQQTGLHNALGQRIRQLVPNLEEHWFTFYGAVATSGEPVRFMAESVEMGRSFSVYAARVGAPADHTVALVFSDITATRRSQENSAFLLQLAQGLASLTDERAIIGHATRALGEHLRVDRCYFAECLIEASVAVVSENWCRPGTPSVEGRHDLREFGGLAWWQEVSRGDFAVADVKANALTRPNAERYAALGLRSYLVQPYRGENDWTAIIVVSDSVPRTWRDDEIQLAEDVVARVWPQVERARADRALEELRVALADRARELEERVRERTALLEDTISELEAYSHSISHDLRAPLRAMRTFAGMLADAHGTSLGDSGLMYLGRIVEASERMDRLIQDVLDYSSTSRSQIRLERIELTPFVEGLVQSSPELRGMRDSIQIPKRLGAVMASAVGLTQCVSNLLGNAVKFAAPDTRPEIGLSSTSSNGRTHMLVRDHGVGVPPSDRERIFEMFYTGHPALGGTGIGLAIVRKAAERIGGSVTVLPTDGMGATFDLELASAP